MRNYEDLILNKNGKPIKILMLSHHCCIRVARYGMVLRDKGYEVHSVANRISYGAGKSYDTNTIWQNRKQLETSIKMYVDMGVDIIHYHNEPHWPAKIARDVIDSAGKQNDVKLISDIHDSDLVRRNIAPVDELEMFNSSDGIVYVSHPIQKTLNRLFKITVPNAVIYNYPTKSMIDEVKIDWDKAKDKPVRLIYEGGINPLGNNIMNQEYRYRDLYPILKVLVEQGNEVHAFVGNADAIPSGQNLGIVLYPPTDFSEMLQKMTEFKYSILIFNNPGATENQVNWTTANKMWDALTAGIPSLACWCSEGEKYVDKHGIGFTFKDIKEIGDCSQLEDKYESVIETIKQKRQEILFENQLWRIENLYAEVLGTEKISIPENVKKLSILEHGEKDLNDMLNEKYIKEGE